MKTPDLLLALSPFITILDKLSIPYFIGGSIASSVYGIARATIDIDIIADIKIPQASKLRQNLDKDYYIDEEMIKNAIQKQWSFNIIHLETAIKIDVFILKEDIYQKNVIQRKIKDTLEDDKKKTEYYFSTPEDIIINKLQWYKMGDSVSERQWLDIIGVIKVQSDSLDKEYLKKWTHKLGFLNLLKRAYRDTDVKW